MQVQIVLNSKKLLWYAENFTIDSIHHFLVDGYAFESGHSFSGSDFRYSTRSLFSCAVRPKLNRVL